jgi:hypothetical protein
MKEQIETTNHSDRATETSLREKRKAFAVLCIRARIFILHWIVPIT